MFSIVFRAFLARQRYKAGTAGESDQQILVFSPLPWVSPGPVNALDWRLISPFDYPSG